MFNKYEIPPSPQKTINYYNNLHRRTRTQINKKKEKNRSTAATNRLQAQLLKKNSLRVFSFRIYLHRPLP